MRHFLKIWKPRQCVFCDTEILPATKPFKPLDSRCENKKSSYCLQWGTSEQKVVEHFTVFCPMQGHCTVTMFCPLGPLETASSCFFYRICIQEGTFVTFFLTLQGKCPPAPPRVRHCFKLRVNLLNQPLIYTHLM